MNSPFVRDAIRRIKLQIAAALILAWSSLSATSCGNNPVAPELQSTSPEIQQAGPGSQAAPRAAGLNSEPWVVPGSVKLANTSGGKVLVLGTDRNPKPAILTWKWQPWADLDEIDNGGSVLCVTVSLADGSPLNDNNETRFRKYSNPMVSVDLYRRQNFVEYRYMPDEKLTVFFDLCGYRDDQKPDVISRHNVGPHDVFKPYERRVVFHPVQIANHPFRGAWNSTGDVELSRWMQSTVDENMKDLIDTAKYMPVSIEDFVAGERIYVALDPEGIDDHVSANLADELTTALYVHAQAAGWGAGNDEDLHVAIVRNKDTKRNPMILGGQSVRGFALFLSNMSVMVYRDRTNFGMGGTLWHEIGHNLGMGHVDGCGMPERIEETYPGPDANINVDGYRVRSAVVQAVPAWKYSDIMSYCPGPKWISAYTYRKMAEYGFGVRPTLLATRPVIIE